MSTTATIDWTNQASGVTQELFYGPDALVTGLPGTGTGWVGASQNPLPSSAGTLTLTGLNDNVKYTFLINSNCTNSQNIYSQTSAIKWVYLPIVYTGPTSGILSFTLPIDPSTGNAGSVIGNVVVTLSGVDRINQGNIQQVKTYPAPLSSSYTDQFNNVNGDVDWTLTVSYKTAGYPSTELYVGSVNTFSTSSLAGVSYLQVRNALHQGVVSQLTLGTNSMLPNTLDSGYASKVDVSSVLSGGTTQQASVTLVGVIQGTQCYARQIRAGAQISGGLFTYIGTNSPISSVPWNIQNGDIVEVTDTTSQGYVFKQKLITKNENPTAGYDVSLKLDIPQGGSTSYTVHFTAYDYSSGASEQLTAVVSITTGQTTSTLVHVNTTLSVLAYNNATITKICITPATNIGVPYYYTCPS